MRKILYSEIAKEQCNAAALGLFNASTESTTSTRERKIIKTKAGYALMEKASKQDIQKHKNITYVKDKQGDSWLLIKSSKIKKHLSE